MESTTGLWVITTSNLSSENKTITNDTAYYTYDHDTTSISVRYIMLSVFITSVNLLVVCLLLTSRECRRKPFFWHVISLSVWFLLIGVIILPLRLDHYVRSEWIHGEIVCTIWNLLWEQNFTLSALIMFCASLDRMLAKVQLVTPLNQKFMHIFNYVLVLFPWFIVVTINTPLILHFKGGIDFKTKYCMFPIHENHLVKWFIFFYLIPFTLLALSIFVLILFYILKEGSWERIPSTITKMEITNLRLSTVASWINSIIFFACWLPYSALIFGNLLKSKDRWKCMNIGVMRIVFILPDVAPVIIPIVWFFSFELRASASSWIKTVRNVIRNRTTSHGISMKWVPRKNDVPMTHEICQ